MNKIHDDIIRIIISFNNCGDTSIFKLDKYFYGNFKDKHCFRRKFKNKKTLCKVHNAKLYIQYSRVTQRMKRNDTYIHFDNLDDAKLAVIINPHMFGQSCCGGKGYRNRMVRDSAVQFLL